VVKQKAVAVILRRWSALHLVQEADMEVFGAVALFVVALAVVVADLEAENKSSA
jgi:hypothetical protein